MTYEFIKTRTNLKYYDSKEFSYWLQDYYKTDPQVPLFKKTKTKVKLYIHFLCILVFMPNQPLCNSYKFWYSIHKSFIFESQFIRSPIMEHHIYLTFLSTLYTENNPYNPQKLKKTVVNLSEIAPFDSILQTNESALKYLLHTKRKKSSQFKLDKLFFFKSPEMENTFKESTISSLSVFEDQMRAYIKENKIPIPWEPGTINYINCGNIDYIDNLKDSIIDMSQAIMEYYKGKPSDDKVILHVDLSGGPRTAIMLMIAIIRLVAFQGIQIGSILYANVNANNNSTVRVYEGISIYNIYDMITGFAEFNQFGSVDTLTNYVNTLENPDAQIKKLIASMGDFSEAVRLSSRGMFQTSMEDIHTVLTDIETAKKETAIDALEGHKNFEIEALKLMSNKIQNNYKTVLDNKEDDLAYIDWCLANGYLQQALALFAEFVPRAILDSKMISLDESIFPTTSDNELSASMESFNAINEHTAKVIEVVNTRAIKINNKIKSLLSKYLSNEFSKESKRIIQQVLQNKKNNITTNITREDTQYPKLEDQLINDMNQIILNEADKETYDYLKYKTFTNNNINVPSKLLRLISNVGISTKSIMGINDFDKEIRRYLTDALIQEIKEIKELPNDVVTVNDQYEITLNNTNKLFKVRDAFISIFTNQNNDLIYRYLFANCVVYQYPIDRFPNYLYGIDGLTLHPALENNPEKIAQIARILNLYRTLKGSRNDTAHAREEKRGQFIKSEDIKRELTQCLNDIRDIREYIRPYNQE
mgnify:FL=1